MKHPKFPNLRLTLASLAVAATLLLQPATAHAMSEANQSAPAETIQMGIHAVFALIGAGFGGAALLRQITTEHFLTVAVTLLFVAALVDAADHLTGV